MQVRHWATVASRKTGFRHGPWLPAAFMLFAAMCCDGKESYHQRHDAVRILSNGILTVEVMEPNAPGRYNTGSRFSNVANVLRAVRGGRDFLFSPIDHDPVNDNCGLAMEFDIDTPGDPPGFTEAPIGGGFLKIGVGVLRKTQEKYDFYQQMEVIERAHTTVQWKEDRAVFEQICMGINGYAYQLRSEIGLDGSVITIRYALTNTGTQTFKTEQYVHNYFCFNSAPVGPGYEVEFPYDFDATGMTDLQVLECRKIRYVATLPTAVNIKVSVPEGSSGSGQVMVSQINGQRIAATTTGVRAYRVFVHATGKYLCPEQFIAITLRPGESTEWIRRYDLQTNLN